VNRPAHQARRGAPTSATVWSQSLYGGVPMPRWRHQAWLPGRWLPRMHSTMDDSEGVHPPGLTRARDSVHRTASEKAPSASTVPARTGDATRTGRHSHTAVVSCSYAATKTRRRTAYERLILTVDAACRTDQLGRKRIRSRTARPAPNARTAAEATLLTAGKSVTRTPRSGSWRACGQATCRGGVAASMCRTRREGMLRRCRPGEAHGARRARTAR
jgi:hypothetical protein